MKGAVEYFIPMANTGPRGDRHHQLEGMFKKVRPARPQYCLLRPVGRNCLAYPEGKHLCVDARSVHGVREHGKMARTSPCLVHPERWVMYFQHSHECMLWSNRMQRG
jgi:hypothetical protein